MLRKPSANQHRNLRGSASTTFSRPVLEKCALYLMTLMLASTRRSKIRCDELRMISSGLMVHRTVINTEHLARSSDISIGSLIFCFTWKRPGFLQKSVAMKLRSSLSHLLGLSLAVSALPQSIAQSESSAKVPTIWVAGDSTTAPDGGHNGTQGWGQYLQYSFGNNAFVNNSAYVGRSARSVCIFISPGEPS